MNNGATQVPVAMPVLSRGMLATSAKHLKGPQPTSASDTAAKQKILLRTSDVAEAIDAVSRIYCPHQLEIRGSNRGVNAELEVIHCGVQPVVGLKYSTPVRIDAGDFRHLMLMMTCVDGSATAVQQDCRATWHRGQTLPLSPGLSTQLDFDGRFAQTSVRLDIERLETLCSRWLNFPLDRPLRFELRPFSAQLEAAWAQAVALIMTHERMGIVLPQAAAMAFDEFMLSLVLAQHPHNYSDDLRRLSHAALPRMVREAEHWMRTGGPETSVSGVAARVGVSLRSLEAGFREWRQTTPTQYLRKVRLDAARAELLTPFESTTVTSVALANGFFHLPRFSEYYRTAFDESPGQTLRRSRPGKR
jgi:AraC-like DNA-binding protein